MSYNSEREGRSERAAEARRQARRRKAIRNRIIFALVMAVLLAAIIYLGIRLVNRGKSNHETNESRGVESTEAETGSAAEESSDSESPAETGTTSAGEKDTTPPVIEGVQSERTVNAGDSISYKQGVTVTDDQDPNPTLSVDASDVDLNTPGTYTVIYTATDASGNTVTVKASVTVKEKESNASDPATAEDEKYMKYLAGLYIDQIGEKNGFDENTTKKEWAEAIWLWTNYELDYASTSDKSSWVLGAIQAFDTHRGDCFNYFCAAKALLNQVGIPNVDVVKSDTSHSSHYWSLVDVGGGWYHYDTTPREGEGDYFFLVTDEQLDSYSEAHENSHIFDHNAYPERATKVITDLNAQPTYTP